MAKTTIAIMYDFDKTLCISDMQDFAFIPNLGLKPKEFWDLTTKIGTKNKMDKILAYMYVMIEECRKKNIKLTKEYLNSLGKHITYFKGVTTWFDRINKFGETLGVEIEHYIISSGIKEIIEASQISKEFKQIYACEFIYDEDTKEAIWPKVAINYTNKTQYIFRISKGTFDILDDEKLNSDIPNNMRHVMYRNMIYIGDGMTDIPCMQVVKDKGGKSIAVYTDKVKPRKLVEDERINFVCGADYSVGSSLEKFVTMTIQSMAFTDRLIQKETQQISRYQTSVEGSDV